MRYAIERVKAYQDAEPDAYVREEWIAPMLEASGYPAEVERLREALRRVAEYDGEWVEEDPLIIRDFARDVLRSAD